MVTALGGIAPVGAFPVGASFLVVVGPTKGLVLIGYKTPRVFRGAFFEEEVFFFKEEVSLAFARGRRFYDAVLNFHFNHRNTPVKISICHIISVMKHILVK